MIVDLSHPANRSVNDGICKQLCTLTYPSIADEVQFIRLLGPGTFLLKVDLKSAYRVVLVNALDRHLLGVQWQGGVYVDQALPFGLRSAPILIMAVADAIGWALMHEGQHHSSIALPGQLSFFPAPYGRLGDTAAVTRPGHTSKLGCTSGSE